MIVVNLNDENETLACIGLFTSGIISKYYQVISIPNRFPRGIFYKVLQVVFSYPFEVFFKWYLANYGAKDGIMVHSDWYHALKVHLLYLSIIW